MLIKPLAIKASYKNISLISETVNSSQREVRGVVEDGLERGITYYYVKNALYGTIRLPFIIYNEDEFLANFATVPVGIDDHFVEVVQVKVPSPY